MVTGTTTIEWVDRSNGSHLNRPLKHDTSGKPIYMTIPVADKGPEESMLKEEEQDKKD